MAINQGHKILLAVFDTGIDYNHPDLINNVHFELDPATGKPRLDSQGRPGGLGKDFSGKDDRASWRAVDATVFPWDRRVPDEQKKMLDTGTTSPADYNQRAAEKFSHRQCDVDAINSIPGLEFLSKYIGPYRSTTLDDKLIHGTHVAGLMTYDHPEFGLIPYRVLDYYRTRKEIIAENYNRVSIFTENLAEAVEDAHRQGVKIVNMSLAGVIEPPADEKTPQAIRAAKDFEEERRVSADKMTKIFNKYDDMLFVASAGNAKGRTDSDTHLQFPCGLAFG